MKRNLVTDWKLGLAIAALALFSTTACQKPGNALQEKFQERANETLGKLAKRVSGARGINQTANVRGNFSGFPQPGFPQQGFTGTSPFGGIQNQFGANYAPNTTQDANQCLQAVQMLPRTRENFLPMVASMTQCLDRVLAQSGNQLFAFAYGNLGNQGQQYFQYLTDWRGTGNYGQSYTGYNSFSDPLLLGNVFGFPGGNLGSYGTGNSGSNSGNGFTQY